MLIASRKLGYGSVAFVFLLAAVAAATFAFDLSQPLGVAAGVPYVALVLLGIRLPSKRYIFVLAGIGTVLTIVGYFFSSAGGLPWVVLSNRGLAISVIWITATLLYINKKKEEKIVELNTGLQQQVKERTADLRQINQDLRHEIKKHKQTLEILTTLRLAAEQSPSMIVITDREGVIEYVNPSVTSVTGYTAEEVIGQNPRMWQWDKTPKEQYEKLWNTVLDGGAWRGEFLNKRKDGSFYMVSAIISAIRLHDGTITHFVAVEDDITEQRKTDQALQQAQKMEAVGQLTGGLAHDFNNLLTVILGNLQLLERRIGDDEFIVKKVAAATYAAQRGADLTHRLLAFSRREVLENTVLDLNQLIVGMDDLLRRTLGEAVEIKTMLTENVWPVEADTTQLETSILNLAVNARHAMEDKGQLTIETENVYLDEAYAGTHKGAKMGDFVMLAVSDTGTGMPAEVIEKVFEPFFTTKEVGKGTGLGLSMIHGFVKQSDGYIDIYSEEGHGTTIRLYFPRNAATDVAAATEAVIDENLPRGSETILVVEDDAGVRDITVNILEELGYHILVAEDGPHAFAVLDEHADIDLLFTDVVMPGGISGVELGKQFLERRPGSKVLYTSGYSQDAFFRNNASATANNLISKPFKNEKLAREVRRILDAD